MSLLSPGVEITEIDASTVAPTVSNSIACFAGNFVQGPVGVYMLITTLKDFISFYGEPTLKNYNDWMQAQIFLGYGNKLFVSRAANTEGVADVISGVTVTSDVQDKSTVDISGSIASIEVGEYVAFGDSNGPILTPYVVMSKTSTSIELDRKVTITVANDNKVYKFTRSINSVFDAVEVNAKAIGTSDYIRTQIPVLNYSDFENKETSIMMNSTTSKIKLISKNPGAWGNGIEVAIANSTDFGSTEEAFEGISLDDLFDYYPTGDEIGVIVRYNGTIQETFTVSFDVNAKDQNNKSTYIENVINTKSNYIFVKDNTDNKNKISSYLSSSAQGSITLVAGTDSAIDQGNLIDAYSVWDNKEDVDVDIIIANELDSGLSAKSLVDTRKDCIAFIGANYSDCVGQKATQAVSNLVNWRKTGSLNYDDMFVVAGANYVYQYNKYLDKNVWVNIAGHIAGLRAQTNTNRASWWASAGQILGSAA